MKIGFFGTPEISRYCLDKLLEEFEISFVVTAEDKPAGRRRKIYQSPVKEVAIGKGITVFQPSDLNDDSLIDEFKLKDADIFVVVAYGRIIPPNIYNIPKFKTINLHPSLLPKYRGAAPVQWALLNGEIETGVTVQIINADLDAGDILLQESVAIDRDMTSEELYDIILPLGANLLKDAIELLVVNKARPVKQDDNEATYCKKIDKENSCINWERPSKTIHNLIRGLNPKPVACSNFRGKKVKIWKTRLVDDCSFSRIEPGYFKIIKGRMPLVATIDGYLEIIQIQPEGKKVMDGISFVNGYRLVDEDHFSN
ncbi:MAG: methionyl-tRNA formyltransferase [Spirochaetota bacterium]|nr:methionyl-tRNA formyltransferase [Spirochaetota bacterium]